MEAQSKRLWIVTLANIAVAGLLLLVIYGIMLALAVLAPEISEWPLYVLVAIGIALSITGLVFLRKALHHAFRAESPS
jgi:predicted Kef-type K+ transport protein